MALSFGEPAPWFRAQAPSRPDFLFDAVAGRYVLMLFLPPNRSDAALRLIDQQRYRFDSETLSAVVILQETANAEPLQDSRGLHWVLDPQGVISRIYGAYDQAHDQEGGQTPVWLLLDPTLRVMAGAPLLDAEALVERLARLGAPAEHAGVSMHAPVLIAPRIFEPEFCERLVALHQAKGDRGADGAKTRWDVLVDDPELQTAMRERLQRRLFPLIARSLGFAAAQVAGDLVCCFDAQDSATLQAQRDSTALGSARGALACSINLNADFIGGDLRFAEFGRKTYRAPAGGAIVYSCALLHEITPLARGRRYAFQSLLFDAADANARAAMPSETAG